MEDLKKSLINCKKCAIANDRRNVVLGRGEHPADILFIGEAPGKSEDLLGEAFVGPSGKLLDEMLKDAQSLALLDHCPTYFITNTLLCRPFVMDRDSEDYRENRAPEREEVLNCMPNILQIYKIVKPRIIIFIGRVSEKFYKKEFPEAIHITHPAALLRHGGKTSPFYLTNVRVLEVAFRKVIL